MSASQILRKRALKRTRSVQFSPNTHRDFKKTYHFQPVNGNHLRKILKDSVGEKRDSSNPPKKTLLKSHSFAYGELRRVFYTTNANAGSSNSVGSFPNGRILLKRQPHSVRFSSQEGLDRLADNNDFQRTPAQWVQRKPCVKANIITHDTDKSVRNSLKNVTGEFPSVESNILPHNRLDSSGSDSGFDSSSPPSDRRETKDKKHDVSQTGHKILSKADPKNVSFFFHNNSGAINLSESEYANSPNEDRRNSSSSTVSNDGPGMSVRGPNVSVHTLLKEAKVTSQKASRDSDCTRVTKPNGIKSILKQSSTGKDSKLKQNFVPRSKTNANQNHVVLEPEANPSKSIFRKDGKVLHKSTSFTSFNTNAMSCTKGHSTVRENKRSVSLGDLYRKNFVKKESEECDKGIDYPKLSSQSFGGQVR